MVMINPMIINQHNAVIILLYIPAIDTVVPGAEVLRYIAAPPAWCLCPSVPEGRTSARDHHQLSSIIINYHLSSIIMNYREEHHHHHQCFFIPKSRHIPHLCRIQGKEPPIRTGAGHLGAPSRMLHPFLAG